MTLINTAMAEEKEEEEEEEEEKGRMERDEKLEERKGKVSEQEEEEREGEEEGDEEGGEGSEEEWGGEEDTIHLVIRTKEAGPIQNCDDVDRMRDGEILPRDEKQDREIPSWDTNDNSSCMTAEAHTTDHHKHVSESCSKESSNQLMPGLKLVLSRLSLFAIAFVFLILGGIVSHYHPHRPASDYCECDDQSWNQTEEWVCGNVTGDSMFDNMTNQTN